MCRSFLRATLRSQNFKFWFYLLIWAYVCECKNIHERLSASSHAPHILWTKVEPMDSKGLNQSWTMLASLLAHLVCGIVSCMQPCDNFTFHSLSHLYICPVIVHCVCATNNVLYLLYAMSQMCTWSIVFYCTWFMCDIYIANHKLDKVYCL